MVLLCCLGNNDTKIPVGLILVQYFITYFWSIIIWQRCQTNMDGEISVIKLRKDQNLTKYSK